MRPCRLCQVEGRLCRRQMRYIERSSFEHGLLHPLSFTECSSCEQHKFCTLVIVHICACKLPVRVYLTFAFDRGQAKHRLHAPSRHHIWLSHANQSNVVSMNASCRSFGKIGICTVCCCQ